MNQYSRMTRIRRAWRFLLVRAIGRLRRQSLIGEILALQLAVAAVLGALALGGLWWASSFVVRDQMYEWGEQWLDNLDQLGAPLYLSGDEKYAGVETYLDQFAEILFVRYYSDSGEPTLTKLADREHTTLTGPLRPGRLEKLATSATTSKNYLIETVFGDIPIVRIARPISSRAVLADGLLGFDPRTSAVEENLLGYVEVGLDFSSQLAYQSRAVLTAVAIAAGILVLLTIASWLICRRALLPLSALQTPLRRLARGEADFSVSTSGHREIVAIVNALNATTSALDEREQKLADLASRDGLTGLPNRSAFLTMLVEEIESVAQSGETDALLYIDLDQFKYVNDSCGPAAGDRVLKFAADRLLAGARPGDIVARFGGDEYAMLLRNVSRKEATDICAGLVKGIQEASFHDGRRSLNLRCSIGATMIRGAKVKPAKLVRRAERARHEAKANGGNQFCFFKSSSKGIAEMAADANWFQQIQTALKTNAFVLHYQPIADVRTGETAYYEVLLRMLVDDVVVSPALFLPAAARLGFMADIDRWVMRQSLQNLAALRADGRDIRFALNVSGSTFDSADFFNELEAELESVGVPLDAIVLEITEQVAVRGLEAAAARMSDLAARGCRFAIDDFGSGYCSYSYLKELPVTFVKIDGSFIANLTRDVVDRKIVAGIADVAAAAGCETIAEHVEDYETLRLLDGLGVTYAQGYCLGRPSAKVTEAVVPGPRSAARRRPLSRRAVATRHHVS